MEFGISIVGGKVYVSSEYNTKFGEAAWSTERREEVAEWTVAGEMVAAHCSRQVRCA